MDHLKIASIWWDLARASSHQGVHISQPRNAISARISNIYHQHLRVIKSNILPFFARDDTLFTLQRPPIPYHTVAFTHYPSRTSKVYRPDKDYPSKAKFGNTKTQEHYVSILPNFPQGIYHQSPFEIAATERTLINTSPVADYTVQWVQSNFRIPHITNSFQHVKEASQREREDVKLDWNMCSKQRKRCHNWTCLFLRSQ